MIGLYVSLEKAEYTYVAARKKSTVHSSQRNPFLFSTKPPMTGPGFVSNPNVLDRARLTNGRSNKRRNKKQTHSQQPLLRIEHIRDCTRSNRQTRTSEEPREKSTNNHSRYICSHRRTDSEDCSQGKTESIYQRATDSLTQGSSEDGSECDAKAIEG